MKILHTADWHIGTKWEGVDRTPDLLGRAVPDVVELALTEQVDMVLIAGDVFERQTQESVHNAAQTLRDPFRALLEANIDIVLLLGNHDSPPLFRFLRSAVELVGEEQSERGQLHIHNGVWIKTISGLQIVHIPYLRAEQIEQASRSKVFELPNTAEMVNWKMGRQLDQIAQALRARLDNRSPAMMTFHGTIQGATVGVNEQSREFTYHQDFMLSPDSLLFNDQVPQYNALGHIHKWQELAGSVPTWYSGSIDRLNRGEREYEPSVMIVEFPTNGRYANCQRIPLPRPTPFLDEQIGTHVELQALCDELGEEKCQQTLGQFTLTCEPTEAYALDQAIRDAFPRLRGVKKAVLRPRHSSRQQQSIITRDIKSLTNPAQTIRSYIVENVADREQEGLLQALVAVEEQLGHDH